ncbi:MAG TPA: methionyl-tRNA formyltransferase [Burkholderiales bacterium]|nr:methionyl-tRNA formyltransferase [Burkholderiales bacterium]
MRLVFAGTPEFAERALARLLAAGHEVVLALTQPDRPAGRGLRASASPVKRLAAARGIEVLQPGSLQGSSAVERVRAARPDALVVAAYGLILPRPLLEAGRHGALNIHASLLPRWRGAAPIQRALLAGDLETGISIMQMDAGLDTGPLLKQAKTPIRGDDDAGTLHDRLAAIGAELIVEALRGVESGGALAEPQPKLGITYARKIEKLETRLDWTRPADELERAVRAFRPSPGASTRADGAELKIWRARIAARSRLAPGEVGDGLIVGCGEGALEVLELQRAGGRRLGAPEFLRGHPLPAGARFE